MSQRSFTNLADRLPVIAFEADARGAWRWVNAQWCTTTNQNALDALGAGWLSAVHADERGRVEREWSTHCASRHEVEIDFHVTAPDGSTRWLQLLAKPFDEAPGGFSGVVIDRTRQRAAETEVNRLAARSRALIASLPDFLFHCDQTGRFLDFHAPSNDLLAVPPEMFLGRPMSEVMPPGVAEQSMAALRAAERTSHIQRFEYPLDGRDFEARVAPMPGHEFLFVVRDVTQRKKFETELIAAREQAVGASRAKSQFLANVSHEIRTPLNGILGVTQLLRTMALPPEASEYLNVLQGSGESLLDIVNDVLDLSKIEANHLELESEVFVVEHLVTKAVGAFFHQCQKKGLTFDCEVAETAKGASRGDAARLRQVITNLVGNAVKFTDEGRVTVRVEREHETLVLTVSDTGPGIAPERQSAIFEPFVQGDGSMARRYGGTGLGLTISRRLVQLMGGDIHVDSEVGQGSTFRVRIRSAPVVIERDEPASVTRSRLAQKTMRVLFAEDNDVNAR